MYLHSCTQWSTTRPWAQVPWVHSVFFLWCCPFSTQYQAHDRFLVILTSEHCCLTQLQEAGDFWLCYETKWSVWGLFIVSPALLWEIRNCGYKMDTCVSGDAFKTVISTWAFTLISHFLLSSRHWAERKMRLRDFFISFRQQLLKHTCSLQASRISTKTLVFASGSRLLPQSTKAHRNKQDKAKIRGGPGSQWRRQWHPTPVFLPGKSHGRRSLVGCSPWGSEESDMTEWLHFHFSLSCIVEGNGNPLQCSCLENPRDGRAWWAATYGVAQSRTWLKWLSSSSSSSSRKG